MNAFQWIFAIAFLVSIAVSLAGIVAVVRAPQLAHRLWWLLGSLFGFVGVTIDWARPDDLYMSFGVAIPVFSIVWSGDGAIVAKATFSFVAAAALWKIRDDAQLRRFQEATRPDDSD